MTLFVSYTRADETLVRVLKTDLDSLGRQVWLDHQIYGGQQWWQEIIRQIQDAEVFVFALSNDSWKSRPCRSELNYALQLGVPVVPVQVGLVESLAISIAKMQIIDYRRRSAETALALAKAVAEACAQARQLPDPLPDPPEMPFEYLIRISNDMEMQEISPKRQGEVIAELRQRLRTEDDDGARNDILKLLAQLRVRNELTVPHLAEIDEILSGIGATKAPPAEGGATRLPEDHWKRAQPRVDHASGSSASSGGSSRTAPSDGSGQTGGSGPTSTPTSPPSPTTRPGAGQSGSSAGHGQGPAPQERVVPAWLTDLVQSRGPTETEAGATVAGTEPHRWPRPSDTPPPPRARKWWLEEQGSDSESPAEPTVETPIPSTQPPTSPPASSPATSRFRTVATLAIAGLVLLIVLVGLSR